jgi:hypothetical protein
LKSIEVFQIPNNEYEIDKSVLSNLETEINEQRQVFRKLTQQIIKDLKNEDNIKSLKTRNDKFIG